MTLSRTHNERSLLSLVSRIDIEFKLLYKPLKHLTVSILRTDMQYGLPRLPERLSALKFPLLSLITLLILHLFEPKLIDLLSDPIIISPLQVISNIIILFQELLI